MTPVVATVMAPMNPAAVPSVIVAVGVPGIIVRPVRIGLIGLIGISLIIAVAGWGTVIGRWHSVITVATGSGCIGLHAESGQDKPEHENTFTQLHLLLPELDTNRNSHPA
jgi:hypothetical protein